MPAEQIIELSADELTSIALQIIRKHGVTKLALNEVACAVAHFAITAPAISNRLTEQVLRTEADGTFEIVVKRLSASELNTRRHTYDTWAAYAPIVGSINCHTETEAEGELQTGHGISVMAGQYARFQCLNGEAQVVCMFGIARHHLPPPRVKPMSRSEMELEKPSCADHLPD